MYDIVDFRFSFLFNLFFFLPTSFFFFFSLGFRVDVGVKVEGLSIGITLRVVELRVDFGIDGICMFRW